MADQSIAKSKSRQVVYGRAAVSSSQPLASAVGLQVLSAGGSAADAAVAMAAMLAVTEPTSNGLGGDFIALHHSAAGPTVAVLGVGASPTSLTLENFLNSPPLTPASPNTVTVPGAVAAWEGLKTRFGAANVSWSRLIQPAAQAARNGFHVHRTTAKLWHAAEMFLKRVDPYTPFVPAPNAGDVFVNQELAAVLDSIAQNGASAFYTGRVASSIVAAVSRYGGVLSLEDLESHKTTFTVPLHTNYGGWTIFEPGAPTHGAVALLALNILVCVETELKRADATLDTHLTIDALRLAYGEAIQRVGDRNDGLAATAAMASDTALAESLAKRLRSDKRCELPTVGKSTLPVGGTVQFCVVDKDGNAVSAVQSNYQGFGTGIVPDKCGFTLHNRGLNFSTEVGHMNCVAGGKRPYHTIMPGMMVRDLRGSNTSEEVVAFGVMGSFMQPQGHVIVARGMIDGGMDPQEALDVKRFRVTGIFSAIESGMGDDAVLVEEDMEASIVAGLRKRGHDVRVAPMECFGRGHVCERRSDGRVAAGADTRADGIALVWI